MSFGYLFAFFLPSRFWLRQWVGSSFILQVAWSCRWFSLYRIAIYADSFWESECVFFIQIIDCTCLWYLRTTSLLLTWFWFLFSVDEPLGMIFNDIWVFVANETPYWHSLLFQDQNWRWKPCDFEASVVHRRIWRHFINQRSATVSSVSSCCSNIC